MAKTYTLILVAMLATSALAYTKIGMACENDSDCTVEYEVCSLETLKCKHRPIFPLRGKEIGGVFIFSFLVAFSNFSGIGGGFGLIVFSPLFGFNIQLAVILSNAQIVISSIFRIATGLGKPHPLRGRHGTLFHFSTISMMIPMNALAAALASLINRVVPDLYIIIIYGIILVGVQAFNLNRLRHIYIKETTKPADSGAKTAQPVLSKMFNPQISQLPSTTDLQTYKSGLSTPVANKTFEVEINSVE